MNSLVHNVGHNSKLWQHLILIGPPGAGCSSLARAYAQLNAAQVIDLEELVAAALDVNVNYALVTVPEARYRECEVHAGLQVITALTQTKAKQVLALGSGCLADAQVQTALLQARQSGTPVVALSASSRTLAHRNGLAAPRSLALGNVNRTFSLLLKEREHICRELADATLDTTNVNVQQAVEQLTRLLADVRSCS